jgi:hypothetical protein
LGAELKSRIKSAGFIINDTKTRMQVRGSRQTVTGLTVNEKVNVPKRYYKVARAMTNSFLTSGTYKHDGINYHSISRLEGILNHIYHIRERLIDLAIDAEKNAEKQKQLHAARTRSKNEYPSGIRRVYFQLVFFKHFIDPKKPLIICEGPTDTVYLKSALRKLASAHPKLASIKKSEVSIDVNFFKYSRQSRDLLQLRGGTPDLKFFLEAWKENLRKFKYHPMEHPVIMLIDNDDGATNIFKMLQSKRFGITISHATDVPFYHIGGPLYLVKTPIKGADNKSCPEDFFEPSVRATKVDGKVFNVDKEHEAAGEYGKVVFAERVVRASAGVIDFSGFDPILARIDAVIDDYVKLKAAVSPAAPATPVPPSVAGASKPSKKKKAAKTSS